jgi:hypothetical protein
MAPLTNKDDTAQKQLEYRLRMRNRKLGLDINQAIRGMQNLIVACSEQHWETNDMDVIRAVKKESLDALTKLMKIERMLDALVDLYATFIKEE